MLNVCVCVCVLERVIDTEREYRHIAWSVPKRKHLRDELNGCREGGREGGRETEEGREGVREGGGGIQYHAWGNPDAGSNTHAHTSTRTHNTVHVPDVEV